MLLRNHSLALLVKESCLYLIFLPNAKNPMVDTLANVLFRGQLQKERV